MKIFKNMLLIVFAVFFATACNDGIDPITPVDPGEDKEAPVVILKNPTEDVIIPFTDVETDLDIEFEVTDDIEVASVVLSFDGNELGSYNDFKDYRRFLSTVMQEDVALGEHTVQLKATDLSGKETIESLTFEVSNKYVAKYDGEIFYMPFEGGLYMELLSETEATVVGEPGFTAGKSRQAYSGAEDAYLTYPTENLLGDEFSAAFWYKIKLDEEPHRAGILVIGPPDPLLPLTPNNRKNGFRFFREGNTTNQTFKLNVGNGTADTWVDGGAAASINPSTVTGWIHLAFTISAAECIVYINGEVVKQVPFTGVDWTGCDILSIMSGAPRFTEWNHWSDHSSLDELRLFNKALTQAEVKSVMGS